MKRTILLAILSIMTVGTVIYRPDDAFQASLQGLTVWWNIVFPGLLPFLALLELMMAFGAVHALGVLMDPLMRRLFRLPGEAGFAMAVGWTAGFPAGAEATAALRRRGAVSRSEGHRLLALSHMASPLFMLIVVGAGFMGRPEQGALIAGFVWLAALVAGVLHARLGRGSADRGKRECGAFSTAKAPQPAGTDFESAGPQTPGGEFRKAGTQSPVEANAVPDKPGSRGNGPGLTRRMASAMIEARSRDGRSFGKALGDAVTDAVYKLMVVGGFMMICSVLVRLLEPLVPTVMPGYALPALVEIHIGAYAAVSAGLPGGVAWNAAILAAVLAWGGCSALLQAGSAFGGTDLSLRRLAAMRLIHAAIAFALTLTAWRPVTGAIAALRKIAAPAASFPDAATVLPPSGVLRAADLHSLWPYMPAVLLLFAAVLGVVALLSAGAGAAARKS